MEFEWDEDKRKANLDKHHIDFQDAATMWSTPVLDPADTRLIETERRFLALGIIGDDEFIIAVIYTLRNDVRRIISARRARRYERTTYKNLFGRGD